MSKFKVGDKVEVLRTRYSGQDMGFQSKIISIDSAGDIWLEGTTNYPTGVCYTPSDLKLVEDDIKASVPNFIVGDIVEAFGLKGEVIYIQDPPYIVRVQFQNMVKESFTLDGKLFDWHKTPLLKLIERPVKEVKFETEVERTGLGIPGCIVSSALQKFIGKKVEVTVKVKE